MLLQKNNIISIPFLPSLLVSEAHGLMRGGRRGHGHAIIGHDFEIHSGEYSPNIIYYIKAGYTCLKE